MPDMKSTSAALTGVGDTVSRGAVRVAHAAIVMIAAQLRNWDGLMMPQNVRQHRRAPPAFVLQRGCSGPRHLLAGVGGAPLARHLPAQHQDCEESLQTGASFEELDRPLMSQGGRPRRERAEVA